MKQKFNFRGQSSLALMIVISVVIVSVSFAVASTAYNQYRSLVGAIDEAQSFLLADSGAEVALLELYRDSDYPGGTITTPEGSIDISLTDLGGDQYELTSLTNIGGSRRQINIILDIAETTTATGHALTSVSIFAGDDVNVNGDDSLMIGDMRTNDGIEIKNGAELQGDVYGRSGTTRIFNGASVVDNPNTGGTSEGNVYSIEAVNIFNDTYIQGDVVSADSINTNNGVTIDGDEIINPSLEIDAVPVPTFDFAAAEAIADAQGQSFEFVWQFENYINLNDLSGDLYTMEGMYYIESGDLTLNPNNREFNITGSIIVGDGDFTLKPRGEYYIHNPQNDYPVIAVNGDFDLDNPKNITEVDIFGVIFATGSADFKHNNYDQAVRTQGAIIDGAAWAGDQVDVRNKVQLKLNETYTNPVQGFDFSIETGSWYDTDWDFRSGITVAAGNVQGSVNLVDFPMLVKTTINDLATEAQADGDDILFTSADGTTKLNHEIEYFNSATGEIVAWVRVPALSPNEDNFFYLYFGNPLASNQENVEATWSSDFAMVHHMEETTSGNNDILDSTANDNDSIAVRFDGTGSDVSANGKIGGAIRMDGSNDRIEIADDPSQYIPAGQHTLQGWVNFDTTSGSGLRQIFAKIHNSSPWESYSFGLERGSKELYMTEYNGAGDYIYSANYYPITTGVWYQFSAVKQSNGKMEVHINGNKSNIDNVTFYGTELDGTGSLFIGTYDGTQDFFDGYLDEIRLVRTARSTDWLLTEFANQNNPATFMTIDGALSYESATGSTFSLNSWSVE